MNQKTSSLFFSIIVIAFGIVSTGQSSSSENARALKCFEIKVTAADEKERPAVNTVNGSGLIGDLCDNRWENTWVTAHDSNGAHNPHPGTARGATWIKFEFNKIYSITQMWVWNYNEDIHRGLNNVIIEYTVDGCTWKKFGDYVFTQAPGTVNYAHNTTVDFNGVAARAVVITSKEGQGMGNYGNPQGMYGLSEVRFYIIGESGYREMPPYNSTECMAPATKLRLKLERGITLDRQLQSIPPNPSMAIHQDDIRLIKSMGFEFVKLLINPELFKSGNGLNLSNMWYVNQIINFAVNEKLPVVVCIHPMPDFKNFYLSNQQKFDEMLGFYNDFAAYLARRWNPDQLAFQLMTEPFGSSSNSDDWNYWDKLQHRIWKAVRQKMPGYTLFLSGDMAGQIEGILNITPVNDENVAYSFTFYEPHLFTFQGGQWQPNGIQYLKNLPYPSSRDALKSMPEFLRPVPEQWQAHIKTEIKRYMEENWNREHLSSRIERLTEWNQYYGGGRLKIWCAEFGCYQGGANPADRCRYIEDLRTIFEANKIGWAYWSYNETFSVMKSNREPFGPASEQTPDKEILRALLPDKCKLQKEEK